MGLSVGVSGAAGVDLSIVSGCRLAAIHDYKSMLAMVKRNVTAFGTYNVIQVANISAEEKW